ncbi:unnamed protein product [Calicophoron daubneyi]|uniref:DH domain-containing protein n=1 Tax=Calicophoron daubneyi TaxID=300641 RepID=A0AAV2TSH0_CALDB
MKPLKLLHILDAEESRQIFYTIESVLLVFEDLVTALSNALKNTNEVPPLGSIMLNWLGMGDEFYGPNLAAKPRELSDPRMGDQVAHSLEFSRTAELVLDYASHLYEARKYLEVIRGQRAQFRDFLSRCHATRFSKRLDLWHFLDCPRGRLVRYPLLLNRLLKLMPDGDKDRASVVAARTVISKITEELDIRTGEAMCRYYLERIELKPFIQHAKTLSLQKSILLIGDLRTSHTLVKAFLFPEILLLTIPYSTTHSQWRKGLRKVHSIPSSSPHLSSVDLKRKSLNTPCGSSSMLGKSASFKCRSSSDAILSHTDDLMVAGNATDRNVQSISVDEIRVERYHALMEAIILKEYALEDLKDGDTRCNSLLHTLAFDKTTQLRQHMFRLERIFPPDRHHSDVTCNRSKGSTHSRLLLRTGRNASLSFHRVHQIVRIATSPAELSLEKRVKLNSNSRRKPTSIFLQAANLQEKSLWLSALSPLVLRVLGCPKAEGSSLHDSPPTG